MGIASFTPWLGGTPGFGMTQGLLTIGASLLAMLCWLNGRLRWAGLFGLAGAGVSGQVALAGGEWGTMLAAGGGLVSVLLSLLSRSDHPEGELKRWVNRLLNPGDDDSKAVDSFIITLIAVNVLSVMMETEPQIASDYATAFLVNETFSTWVFSVEYILRIWVAPLDPRFEGGLKGRARYAITGMAMVDLVAILPFFLQFIQLDLRIARAIRLMRLLRILKMGRYAHAVHTLANVVGRKKEELAITTFVSVMLLILCASVMYFTEHSAQPEAFRSIPSTMWWAVVTLTSVGYGDVSPITGLGQVVGAIVCMIGVLLVSLPTGILASGFLEEMREQRRGRDSEVFGFCPHCGEQLLPGEDLG